VCACGKERERERERTRENEREREIKGMPNEQGTCVCTQKVSQPRFCVLFLSSNPPSRSLPLCPSLSLSIPFLCVSLSQQRRDEDHRRTQGWVEEEEGRRRRRDLVGERRREDVSKKVAENKHEGGSLVGNGSSLGQGSMFGRGEGGEKIPGRLGRLAYVLVNLDDAPRARTSQAIRGLAGRSQSERERRQRARLRELVEWQSWDRSVRC
jgi:hypothetical protein